MKDIHLICNPTSGKGKTAACLEKIQAWAKTQPELNLIVHLTENVGHATIITQDLTITNKPTTIIGLGGDGTINEILNGIANFEQTTIGILPFGSGNDFVRALNMVNPDPITLMDCYVNHPNTKLVDFLLLNDKYRAINEVGLGMSAEVIAYRNKMRSFSPETQYKIATAVRSLLWKSFTYDLAIDKGPISQVRSMWFTMNNGIAIGGGIVTAPDAKIDDGLISVSYVKKFGRLKTISHLLKCKKGKIKSLKAYAGLTCKEVDLGGKDMTVEYDGNLLEHQDHVNVKIIPNKLNLLMFQKIGE